MAHNLNSQIQLPDENCPGDWDENTEVVYELQDAPDRQLTVIPRKKDQQIVINGDCTVEVVRIVEEKEGTAVLLRCFLPGEMSLCRHEVWLVVRNTGEKEVLHHPTHRATPKKNLTELDS